MGFYGSEQCVIEQKKTANLLMMGTALYAMLASKFAVFGHVELFFVFLYDTASIVSAKAEGVAQSSTYGAFLCFVKCKVEVVVDFFVLVAFFVVDGGRNDVVLYSQAAD